MSQTLEQIETKIAYLERANSELSDVVFRQHQEIETLRAHIAGSPPGSMRRKRTLACARRRRSARRTTDRWIVAAGATLLPTC